MDKLNLPRRIKEIIESEEYYTDDIGMSQSKVLIFKDKVLKIQPVTESTKTESVMMSWLSGKLPVPKCLYHEEFDGTDYLLMTKLNGKMACSDEYMNDPKLLVSIIAETLKQMWRVDISDCPVNWNTENKLIAAEKRMSDNFVDIENAENGTHGAGNFKTPKHLLEWLTAYRPEEELVLSHGDFCLPNIVIDNGKLSGLIDLGHMGISDKWQDIALCYRSLKHNFEGKFSGKPYGNFAPSLFFEALEIEPDFDKLNYYILLDELF